MNTLSNIAKDHKVNSVVIERNFGDGIFNGLLKSVLQKVGYLVEISPERSRVQKERRIVNCLEPLLNQHKLVVNKALVLKDYKSTENPPSEEVNRYRLFYQLTCIAKDKRSWVSDDGIVAVVLSVH
ncbi:MAG: hypothetical protein WBX25_36540 [Rhodomicrobium sp.]